VSTSAMLRRELLKLLDEDEEFRLAVAAKLGLREILEELRKLREDFNKLYAKSLEHDKRFEAIERKLLEHDKRFEAIESELKKLREDFNRHIQESSKRFEAIERKLLEHDKRFEAIERRLEELISVVKRHGEAIDKLASQIAALGNRYGIYTDEAFRESMKYVVQDLLKVCRVERWIYYDSEGFVYGAPSIVEVDVYIHNDQHILVEFKASIDRGDVLELHRIGQLYEKVTGRKPKLLIVSPAIRKRARELAEKLGIEIRGVVSEV